MLRISLREMSYGPLRAPELRWLCSERGLSIHGFKQDLVARLSEQDQQGVESTSECTASGLEPFRELEELAAQLTARPASPYTVNPRTAAKAKEPPPTKAAGGHAGPPPQERQQAQGPQPRQPIIVGPKASMPSMAPAQAKMPPAIPAAVPVAPVVPPATNQPGLTEDERALRGLLEFFACSDVKTGEGKLFASRYRDFVRTVFDFLQSDIGSTSAGSVTSAASTAAAAAAAAAAATTDAILRGNLARAPGPEEADNSQGSQEPWSSDMWQKCKEVIDTHLQASDSPKVLRGL